MTDKYIRDVAIFRADRARSSTLGNPSWVLHTDRGPYRTKSNASLGYGIENLMAPAHRPAEPHHVIGDNRPRVTLVTTAAGHVFGIIGADGNWLL